MTSEESQGLLCLKKPSEENGGGTKEPWGMALPSQARRLELSVGFRRVEIVDLEVVLVEQ